ncbi:MAG: STAS domain-containing protein [Anaerolineae bacterium]|nr:STAS domain-containing protein [Anaerolineae bacterium]
MDVRIETVEHVTVIELAGRWDAQAAPDIETHILPLVEPKCCFLFDLHAVTYLSSAGLRSLLILYRTVQDSGGLIGLADVPERIRDTMAITGFLAHFDVYDSIQAGIVNMKV